MSIPQYTARQSPAFIQHDLPRRRSRTARRETLGLAGVALVLVPAAFWASIAWFVWGWLGAAIVSIVVLIVSTFTMGLLRSASAPQTPAPAMWPEALRQAA